MIDDIKTFRVIFPSALHTRAKSSVKIWWRAYGWPSGPKV